MAPKCPSAMMLEAELAGTVRDIYNGSERDELTVNLVRERVESKLGLDDGFFKRGEWKVKSKDIIKDTVEKLEIAGPPSSQAPAPTADDDGDENENDADTASPKASPKKPPPAEPTKKRRRAPAAVAAEESSSELSELNDDGSEESEQPAKKKKAAGRGPSRAKRVVDSDNEDDGDKDEDRASSKQNKNGRALNDTNGQQSKPKSESKAKSSPKEDSSKPNNTTLSDTDSILSEVDKYVLGEDIVEGISRQGDGSDSSDSEVVDEPPKRNPKAKEPPKGRGAGGGQGRGKAKGAGPKPAAEPTPDEAEIKKLQGHLVKCGVRKIWAFELKKCGDDSRAKIRHLKGMLKEVGMEGRFSEAKAKEIKERRELLADLEAVTEMNKNWGVRSSRGSRNRKSMKLPSDDEDDDDGDDDGEGGGKKRDRNGDSDGGRDDESGESEDEEAIRAKAQARRAAKYRADMAFLGDESESD